MRNIFQCISDNRGIFCSNICPTRCNVTQFISSGNCSTCFGWYHYPSSGAQIPVSAASGICHTVTATCVAGSSNGVTKTRCCRYSCLRSWWWVVVPPETCSSVSRWNKLSPWLISNLMHKILIYLYIIHLLKSFTCFEHYPDHLQEVYVVILYRKPLVSSLSAGDCLVHQLRKKVLS